MAKITLYLKDAQIRSEVSGILTSGMVGVEVELVCDESWEDLSKTLVCRAGDVVKTILVQNDRAVVAHETMVAGKWLELGVEGRNDDGSVVIPTLWERCCIVLPGADSSADAAVDPNGDYYFTFTNSTGDQYLTCTMLPFDDTAIITANEEIVYAESEGTETISYEWKNTGIAFVSSGVTPGSGNVLYGKKIVTCGDSFTAGSASYPAHIANRNNMTLVNMAVAGSKLTNIADSSQTPFSVDLYKNVPADADYIIISFGLNEIGDFNELGDTLVGTKSDTANTTIWGAYNVVFTHLITRNPFVKIGVIIPDAWMTDAYATIIRNICAYWGIPYLDLKGADTPLGIGGKYTEMSDTAKSLRNTAFQTSDSDAHPNEKAHEYRSTFIENFLRSL